MPIFPFALFKLRTARKEDNSGSADVKIRIRVYIKFPSSTVISPSGAAGGSIIWANHSNYTFGNSWLSLLRLIHKILNYTQNTETIPLQKDIQVSILQKTYKGVNKYFIKTKNDHKICI